MQMTDSEIVRSYNDAKDKNKQISILKDLNLCSRYEICKVLMRNGVELENPPKKRGRKPANKNTETGGPVSVNQAHSNSEYLDTNHGSIPNNTQSGANGSTPPPNVETQTSTYTRAIPPAVIRVLEQRVETLTDEIAASKRERDEICTFLTGV